MSEAELCAQFFAANSYPILFLTNSHRAKAPYMAPSIIGRSASFLEETVNRYLTRGLHSTFYIRK